MPTFIQGGREFPLSAAQIETLWQATLQLRQYPDSKVAVRAVTPQEMQRLNTQYRGKSQPTNILTFSYPVEDVPASEEITHDVVVCLLVAMQEAEERAMPLHDYTALLLVHAFLHVTGLDHERSGEEAVATHEAEQQVLQQCGFSSAQL